jgi:hypothetical protein
MALVGYSLGFQASINYISISSGHGATGISIEMENGQDIT